MNRYVIYYRNARNALSTEGYIGYNRVVPDISDAKEFPSLEGAKAHVREIVSEIEGGDFEWADDQYCYRIKNWYDNGLELIGYTIEIIK